MNQNLLRVYPHTDAPGTTDAPAFPHTLICLHVGPATQMACQRNGESYRGLVVHGDVDIIPAHTPSRWEFTQKNSEIILSLSPELLNAVAEQHELEPRQLAIRNRFQIRDSQLEHLGWALKIEMEQGYPSGGLYTDSLAVAMAAHLITNHSSAARTVEKPPASLAGRKLKQVLAYIEDNLHQNLSLDEIAAVAHLSSSRFKVVFHQATGLPVYQYVIRRRVERAKALLSESDLPISQIALATGFAHQSHLARHLRRLYGVSPQAIRKLLH